MQDILKELEKPGRDPRPEFKTANLRRWRREGSGDLRPGMILEGVVTNVATFGAFVDIGVHQDGLVHVSALSNTFVKDPHDVVKAGQVVKVKVLEVDLAAPAHRPDHAHERRTEPEAPRQRPSWPQPASRGQQPGRPGPP